jgi:uncharacterized protein YndB with AHSA1/START domain
MWKWILGAVVLIVLLIGSGMWYGFRKMTQFANGDSTVTLTMGATPDHVFSLLATGDSVAEWMVAGRVRPSRGGPLRKGDTIYVEQRDSSRMQRMSWVVGDVTPGKAVTLNMISDTLNVVAMTRRYTVMGQGDSTVVFSTVSSPMVDSIRNMAARDGKNSGMIEFTTKMMVGMLRMQNQLELRQLKAHIEGAQAPPPPPARP